MIRNLIRHDQTRSNRIRHDQTLLSKLVEFRPTRSDIYQTCSDMFRHVQTCSDMFLDLKYIYGFSKYILDFLNIFWDAVLKRHGGLE
jgi:hypothetical protein